MQTRKLMIAWMLALLVPAGAEPASKSMGSHAKRPAGNPEYRSESPLPEGWPKPGPYNQVVMKSYPAYRAAFTADSRPNGGFWKLFKHIQRQDIPMTAPVEMKMDPSNPKVMKMEQMAFLYQSPDVGETGADGDAVEVRDMPAVKVLAYAWQGGRSKGSVAKARAVVDAELAKRKLSATSYRVFGYNSPMMPSAKQTHELQVILK